jgi:hypothetical protein
MTSNLAPPELPESVSEAPESVPPLAEVPPEEVVPEAETPESEPESVPLLAVVEAVTESEPESNGLSPPSLPQAVRSRAPKTRREDRITAWSYPGSVRKLSENPFTRGPGGAPWIGYGLPMRISAPGLALLVLGCSRSAAPQPEQKLEAKAEVAPTKESASPETKAAPAPERPLSPEEQALDQARATARALGGRLKEELMSALGHGEAADALKMCAGKAQDLTREVGRAQGVAVGRSSLRLRNTERNQGPAWVQDWLERQGERKISGVEGVAEVVDTARGKMAHVIIPIGIEPPCLKCHGPADALDPAVKTGLAQHYPKDEATGYAVGDLRGALWAEARVK